MGILGIQSGGWNGNLFFLSHWMVSASMWASPRGSFSQQSNASPLEFISCCQKSSTALAVTSMVRCSPGSVQPFLRSCWNQASPDPLGLGVCGVAGLLTALSSWGLLPLIRTLGEVLLKERWGSLCEQCWLMCRQNVVHFPSYCSQPASPVPVTPVSRGFPQVTVPSGAGALLLVKLSSNTSAEVVAEHCF